MNKIRMNVRFVRMLVASVVLASGLGLTGNPAVTAQESGASLTVTVVVCPQGFEGDPFDLACLERRARAYTVSVNDAGNGSALVAADVRPDANGVSTVVLPALAPTQLQISVKTEIDVGSRDVSCWVDDQAAASEFVGAGAAAPIVVVDVPIDGAIGCTISLFGDADRDEWLDIVTTTSAADGDDGVEVSSLPNTGVGSPTALKGVPLAVYVALVVLQGLAALALRRSRIAS